MIEGSALLAIATIWRKGFAKGSVCARNGLEAMMPESMPTDSWTYDGSELDVARSRRSELP